MTQHFIIFAFFAPNFRLELAVGWGWAREAQTEQQQVDDLKLKTEAVAAVECWRAAARRGNDRLVKHESISGPARHSSMAGPA